MTRRPYPKYTTSGVGWRGAVPEHWEVRRLKYVASINDETLAETTDVDYEFEYVDIGNVDAAKGIVGRETHRFENAPSRARRIVRAGDTIVSTVRTYLRAIAAIREPGDRLIVSTGFAVVRPRGIDASYLSYALRSPYFVETVVSRSTGVSYPAVNASEVGNIEVPLPPLPEQRAIAAFLDRQTAKIDALVEKKRRLIELLKEKRAALISHAVTKGLNPDLPMKDSGIEWLGRVPEHWDVTRFGTISWVVRGASPRPAGDPTYFFGDHVPWITVGEVTKDTSRELLDTETMLTEEGSRRSRLFKRGTLVLTNSGATLGVPKILGIDGCANDGIVAFLNVSPRAESEFLYYYLASLTDMFRDRIRQGSGQPNLNTDIVRATPVLLPPAVEQRRIVQLVEASLGQLEKLESKVQNAISRLLEYRTALISAAVTGKIDVRGEFAQ